MYTSSLRYPLVTRYKVVKGFYVVLLEKGPQEHIATDTKVHTVLLLYRPHVGVVALVAQFPIIVPRAVTSHARSIISASHKSLRLSRPINGLM